jgi:hypothetical protein
VICVACIVIPPPGVIAGVAMVGSSALVGAKAAVEAGGRSVRKGDGRVEELELELEELARGFGSPRSPVRTCEIDYRSSSHDAE